MKTTLLVCLLAGVLRLATEPQPLGPILGTWEGNQEGARAVTLTIREARGKPEGTAVFYILRDEGSGFHTGAATPAFPLKAPQWDGRIVRFRIEPVGTRALFFEMITTGRRTARLKRIAMNEEPELTVTLWLHADPR